MSAVQGKIRGAGGGQNAAAGTAVAPIDLDLIGPRVRVLVLVGESGYRTGVGERILRRGWKLIRGCQAGMGDDGVAGHRGRIAVCIGDAHGHWIITLYRVGMAWPGRKL